MYSTQNYKSAAELKREVEKNGDGGTIYQPGLGETPENGIVTLEGPHFPKAHTWYARVQVTNGLITKILK